MSFNYSPRIVTDNLIVCLDVANTNSYVSGNTTWNDLSRSKNNGILTGGTTYFSQNLGQIRFNGSTGYGTFDFNNRSSTVNTVEMFFRWRVNNNNGMFVGFQSYDMWTSGGNLGFNTGASDVWGISSTVVTQLNLIGTANTNWHHYIFVFANQVQNNKIYIDTNQQILSQQRGTTNLTANRSFPSSFRLSGWLNSTDYIINGDYSIVRIYNRELSQQEIIQNYNANKGRFGLT